MAITTLIAIDHMLTTRLNAPLPADVWDSEFLAGDSSRLNQEKNEATTSSRPSSPLRS